MSNRNIWQKIADYTRPTNIRTLIISIGFSLFVLFMGVSVTARGDMLEIGSPPIFWLGVIMLVGTVVLGIIFLANQNKYPPATTKETDEILKAIKDLTKEIRKDRESRTQGVKKK